MSSVPATFAAQDLVCSTLELQQSKRDILGLLSSGFWPLSLPNQNSDFCIKSLLPFFCLEQGSLFISPQLLFFSLLMAANESGGHQE